MPMPGMGMGAMGLGATFDPKAMLKKGGGGGAKKASSSGSSSAPTLV